jgi:rubrerythrin
MLDYCGFFSLQDAKQAREQLRLSRIRSEIVLREPPDASWDAPPEEEYWIRVDAARIQEAHQILGVEETPRAPADDQGFACSECGYFVNAEESFCPECGARFDED